MRLKFTLLLFLVLLTTPDLFAQTQKISECANKPPVQDSRLQNALQKITDKNPAIEILANDSPCEHTKTIVRALNRTIDKNSFNLARHHSFASIKNGEHSFSAERFVFKTNQAAAAIAKTLKNRSVNTLQIESLTLYDFLVIKNNLLIFIADRESYHFNKPLFGEIKNHFQAEY